MVRRCLSRYTQLVFNLGLIAMAIPSLAANEPILLHWDFDSVNSQPLVSDLSGNRLDGSVTARIVSSPSGQALAIEGTPAHLASVTIPNALRLGKKSWTFMCMIKPLQFEIESKQNQRRLFSYGKYPDANLVLDIKGSGHMTCYFCYKDSEGNIISTGGSCSLPLSKDEWSHIALVCDRQKAMIRLYVNGYCPHGDQILPHFDGDYSLDGRLTVGSSWQNVWALVDEVKVLRHALSDEAIENECNELQRVFPIVETPSIKAAKIQLRLERLFHAMQHPWQLGHYARVRHMCQTVLNTPEAPAHFHSYAQLRMAQSYLAQGQALAARGIWHNIEHNRAYPKSHREEAARNLHASNHQTESTQTEIPKRPVLATTFYISPQGNDDQSGTRLRPFATLKGAQSAIRKLKKEKHKVGPVVVTLLPGKYPIQQTISFDEDDSGQAEAPIVYRTETPDSVTFYGGARLNHFCAVSDATLLKRIPAESQPHVLQCDLKALGITDYGQLQVRGFGQPASPPTLELYVDQVPMPLARWPNEGFVGIGELLNPGSQSSGEASSFTYLDDRHARWTQASDAWIFGYFHFLWADAMLPIGRIDPQNRTLTTAVPYHYGGRGMSPRQGIQYYAFNLLEEIDRPGEWYLDRDSGILYLWPPHDLQQATVEIGLLNSPMITLTMVSHVRFEGFDFDLSRYNGIVLKDCTHCDLIRCTVRRMAGNGIMIHGGHHNRLLGCDIHTIGRRATEIIGGDRATLTAGHHLVENCQIHDFGRIDRTYTPAIQLEGVGHRIAHNLMYKGPSSAMRIEGNNHLIEWNEVHSVVRESDDQGALELFRNPTYRGVVFRYNYLHHIGKTGTETSVHGQAAIRFDDAISGMLVYGNTFYRCANGKFGAIQMNSGRDNHIENNLFIDCKQGISGGWQPGNHVWTSLRNGDRPTDFFQTPLYLKHYPRIATMLEDPGKNSLWRNVFYRCGMQARRTDNIDFFQNIDSNENPGFFNASEANFQLLDNAPIFERLCLSPIPFHRIGLYESPARASWPVETTPVDLPDWRNQDTH